MHIIMLEIDKKLDSIILEMFQIKDNRQDIEIEKLLNFSEKFFGCNNLIWDLINNQIIKRLEDADLQDTDFVKNNEDIILSFFNKMNGKLYNRLVIDSLLLLNTEKSNIYIQQILDEDSYNKELFYEDFGYYFK